MQSSWNNSIGSIYSFLMHSPWNTQRVHERAHATWRPVVRILCNLWTNTDTDWSAHVHTVVHAHAFVCVCARVWDVFRQLLLAKLWQPPKESGGTESLVSMRHSRSRCGNAQLHRCHGNTSPWEINCGASCFDVAHAEPSEPTQDLISSQLNSSASLKYEYLTQVGLSHLQDETIVKLLVGN